MRDPLRGLGLLLVALGFFAVGADLYWSWKAHAWSMQPISFYLDLIEPDWTTHVRLWSFASSLRTAQIVNTALGWPVWGPAFAAGGVLMVLTGRR